MDGVTPGWVSHLWSHPQGPNPRFWCSWGFQERERSFWGLCKSTLLNLKGREGEKGGMAAERAAQLCQNIWMQSVDPQFGRARAPCHLPPVLLRHLLQNWCISRIESVQNPPLSCKPLLPLIQKILQHLSLSVNQPSSQTCEIVMDCLI